MLTMQATGLSRGHMQAARPCWPTASSIDSLSSAFSGCALRQPSAARQPLRPCRQLTVARRAGAGGGEGEEEGGRRRGRGRDGNDRDGDRGGRSVADQSRTAAHACGSCCSSSWVACCIQSLPCMPQLLLAALLATPEATCSRIASSECPVLTQRARNL